LASANLLAPSILSADFAALGEAVRACEAGGADLIHVDVMDGHFVPNLTMGPATVAALRRVTRLPLDVHLMVERPETFLEAFAQAGADVLTVHAEATPHPHRAIQRIHQLGLKAGLALNPGTPLEFFEPLLPELDQALLMSVDPGFGGQEFLPSSLPRLKRLKELRDRLNPLCRIEVDGGIHPGTIRQAAQAGAEILVAGSAIFSGDIVENIAALRRLLEG
jgi:ribulose-phosphate 3-epimerase